MYILNIFKKRIFVNLIFLKKINFNRERKTIKNKNKFVENKKNHIFAT